MKTFIIHFGRNGTERTQRVESESLTLAVQAFRMRYPEAKVGNVYQEA